jgi:RND family efflux transporter MFP subunit
MQARTQAKVNAAQLIDAKAHLAGVELELRNATVRAPDDGVVTSSVAAVGAMPAAGAEMFKLIRGDRLEWRAQAGAQELAGISAGQPVEIVRPDGGVTTGAVRQVSPVLDKNTLTGIVYVDLPPNTRLQVGSFVSGTIVTGRTNALTVPASAVTALDGFHYALTVDAGNRVHAVKLTQGRAQDQRVEVVAGLRPDERIVASGVGLLSDGDVVKVLAASATVAVAGGQGRVR